MYSIASGWSRFMAAWKETPSVLPAWAFTNALSSAPKLIELALTCHAPASVVTAVFELGFLMSRPSVQRHDDSNPARTRITSSMTARRWYRPCHGPSAVETLE